MELDAEMDIMSPGTGPLSMQRNALVSEAMRCHSMGFDGLQILKWEKIARQQELENLPKRANQFFSSCDSFDVKLSLSSCIIMNTHQKENVSQRMGPSPPSYS